MGDPDLAHKLHSCAIHLLRYVRQVDPESGLSAARLSAMSVLVFRGPSTVSELAALEQVAVPTMTRIVAALEKSGLLERRTDARDRRSAILQASPKGEEVLRSAQRLRVERIRKILKGLQRSELGSLESAVDALAAAIARAQAEEPVAPPRRPHAARRRF
jgi:DNA-binding MarR family transcriptional regulator